MEIELTPTNRGFQRAEFKDRYGAECSIQKSSLATEDCIWLGTNQAERHHVTGDVIGTRMHLTREMVATLLPHLHRFVETGEL